MRSQQVTECHIIHNNAEFGSPLMFPPIVVVQRFCEGITIWILEAVCRFTMYVCALYAFVIKLCQIKL